MKTSAMTAAERAAFDSVRRALAHLRSSADAAAPDEIDRWSSELGRIEAEASKRLDCSIAFLGESGAGKSSLINAILGIDLLPHDAGSAVTSSVTKISFQETGFSLDVELKPREHFLERFRENCAALREVSDADAAGRATGPPLDGSIESVVRAVTGLEVGELLRKCSPGQEHDHLKPEVLVALRAGGRVRWHGKDAQDADLKKQCREYLSARNALWPLVQCVEIRGPFPLLRSGLRFVDVPGLNDPDPARTRVAKSSLQAAQLVWLVLNGKRVMTDALMGYLRESDLLKRLQLEGRLASLVLVATHADQFDEQGLMNAFGLSEDATIDEFMAKHRERVSGDVRQALLSVWDELVADAGANVAHDTVAAGRDLLRKAPLFSVSSTESLLLRGVTKSKKPAQLGNDDQTGVPRLVAWVAKDYVAGEERRHRERIAHRTQGLVAAMRSTLTNRSRMQRSIADLHPSRKGGVKGLQARASDFLNERIAEHARQAEKDIEAKTAEVVMAIRAGVSAAEDEIKVGCANLLGGIHWATLRAISRRDGVFFGSRRNWDLPVEFASLVTRRVVFRWAELFDITAKTVLKRIRQSCTDLLAQHATLLSGLIAESIGGQVSGFERLERPAAALTFDIDLRTTDIEEMLDSARMRFEQELVDNLRERLRPAFEGAAQEFGFGMRARMVETLSKSLIKIAPDVIPILASDLAKKIAEVKSILNEQVAKSHKAVQRVAHIEAKNLETALFERSPTQLLGSAEVIDGGLSLLMQAEAA